MRIFVVIGTRPEAIKMLPIVKELKKHSEIDTKICFSFQHEKMALEVFDEFNLSYDYCFERKKQWNGLNEMTLNLLNYFDVIFKDKRPDLVLVHGDTTTAFCAALAAFNLGIRVVHIEAGLRSYNNLYPFPEEFNRVSIDAMSYLCFAPTKTAAENLKREGKKQVFTVGNTVIDALEYSFSSKATLSEINDIKGKKILLVTMHRRENLGERMRSSLLAIKDILESRDDLFAIMPAHPNPEVRRATKEVFQNIKNIKISEPLPMRSFHCLLTHSFAVFTDSGGIQEEAAYLGVPLFLLRDNTERPECVETGNTLIVGCDRYNVAHSFLSFLNDEKKQQEMRKRTDAFGDGHASEKIVDRLLALMN